MKRKCGVVMAILAAFVLVAGTAVAQQAKGSPKAQEKVSGGDCFGCHEEVGRLWKGAAHADLGCGTCHARTEAHLRSSENRPVTNLSPAKCGECHPEQFKSSMAVNWEAPARLEKGVPGGRSPLQDKLLAPHGFTVEHNEPRAHPFMVADMVAVDRFAGGRYRYRDPWGVTRPGKLWDVVEDTNETVPGLAKAGNPTCFQCKTDDLILKWKYLGDQDPRARWSRSSDVNEVAKDVQNAMGCIHCHDPHGTRPRVVRDALIEGVLRDGANPYAPDKGKDALQVVSFRDDFRKIGLVKDSRSNLLCGQCHVEYACNAGIPPEGEGKIGYDDRRTNYFPMRNALDLLENYNKVGFRDFKHAVTGARLVKLQHPEMETYWGSAHERAGVKCVDCHMAKMKKGKETFTSHAMIRPGHHVETVCLGCHKDSSPQELKYQIDSVRNYTRGKIRKAEYHLGVLIDTYAQAAARGVPEDVLAQARRQHEIAHVLWEWWTAENSDGWHNPELARKSLLASEAEARKGILLLQDAMKPKTGAPIVR